ncbi:hypothetical protein BZA05DRAFT_459773, partial [Tricharina praecox]|uniref:uncharacterized protein n=1 Tax=Tricharina praecox TaxID=43433 RepID=UPI00221EB448
LSSTYNHLQYTTRSETNLSAICNLHPSNHQSTTVTNSPLTMPPNTQPPRLTWRQYKEYQRLLREVQAPPGCSHCDSPRKESADLQARCVQLVGQLATAQSPSTRNHERPGRIRREAARAAARAAAAENIATAEEAEASATSLVEPADAGPTTSEGDVSELISVGVHVTLIGDALDAGTGSQDPHDDSREAVVGGGMGAEMSSAAPVQQETEVVVDLASEPAPYQEAAGTITRLTARSCLHLRWKLLVWPALLVAAVLLFGIVPSLPATTTARQALCPLRWSSAKLDAATHSFPAVSWPVSNKSEFLRPGTVVRPLRLPAEQASEMVLVKTSPPPGGADAWASQLPPQTRFWGTALLVVLVAGVVGAWRIRPGVGEGDDEGEDENEDAYENEN